MTARFVRPGEDPAAVVARALARWGQPEPLEGPRLFPEGPVLRGETAYAPSVVPCPPTRWNELAPVREGLQLWPEAVRAIASLVTVLELQTWPDPRPGIKGCVSGHAVRQGQRIVYVTIDDPDGCRQGVLHEWAHLQLRALGIDLETHDGWLMASPATDRLVSPIRRDKLRPPTAVLHAVYAWTVFTASDLQLARAGARAAVQPFLNLNVWKLAEGRETLARFVRWTPEGAPFGQALLAWIDEILDEARALVDPATLASYVAWVRSTPVSHTLLVDPLSDDLRELSAFPR